MPAYAYVCARVRLRACVCARCICVKRCKENNATNIHYILGCCIKDNSSGRNENRMRTNREQIGGKLFYGLVPMKTPKGSEKGLEWLLGLILVLFPPTFPLCSSLVGYGIQLFTIVLGGMSLHWIVRIEYQRNPIIVVGS